MTVFKCKMCGSPLEVAEGASTATCEYCRTQQTLPRLDDDRRANLYDRGNHFRRASEYDKAMRTFEAVLAEDPSDAEAYWSIVLCRFGVEYVQDPATGRQVPTVNRMQSSSILADEDYKRALENADALQRGIYEEQAREIARIQEGIAQVAAKEEPFDVFICYKETGADGRRTRDSVKAGELYHALTSEGFRVFYAPVTLEDKLGQAYEPYIYSALQSSSAMVVIGSKAEHFAAPWVRNEWSRYLALIKAGAKKTLIPAYFDMDPYDLPEEFSHLQAQDMSKIGFLQDLVRGIKKVCGKDERPAPAVQAAPVAAAPVAGASGTAASLLKRAEMFLADGEWDRAKEYAERVLDIDPTCAGAYLVQGMWVTRCGSREALAREHCRSILSDGEYGSVFLCRPLKKAFSLGTPESKGLVEELRALALPVQFGQACDARDEAAAAPLADQPPKWKAAAEKFDLAQGHPGAEEGASECREHQAEAERQCAENDERVAAAKEQAEALWTSRGEGYADYDGSLAAECERVRQSISDLADWRGADKALAACDEGVRLARKSVADDRARKASEQIEKAEARLEEVGVDTDGSVEAEFKRIADSLSDVGEWESAKEMISRCGVGAAKCRQTVKDAQAVAQRNKILITACIVLAVVAAALALWTFAIHPAMLRSQAEGLQASGSYSEAAEIYDELGMSEQVAACRVSQAEGLVGEGSYSDAADIYDALDMDDEAQRCRSLIQAQELESKGSYGKAAALYEENGRDQEARACREAKARQLREGGSYSYAAALYDELGLTDEATECRKLQASQLEESGDYESAATLYDELGLSDEAQRCRDAISAQGLEAKGDYASAASLYDELGLTDEAQRCRDVVSAQGLEESGDYESAANLYGELGMADEALACQKASIAGAEVGDTVAFGSYGQAGVGAQAIEWVVLDKQDGKALLVSKYALDCKPYNEKYKDVTWETCTLRSWLNGEFYETAFSESERALVAQTMNSNPDNADYGTEGGADTTDSVFLLSIDEAEKYFSSDDGRVCYPTHYASIQGVGTNSDTGACNWWLRSPGDVSGNAAVVDSGGYVGSYGWNVGNAICAVRPAIWVNLE